MKRYTPLIIFGAVILLVFLGIPFVIPILSYAGLTCLSLIYDGLPGEAPPGSEYWNQWHRLDLSLSFWGIIISVLLLLILIALMIVIYYLAKNSHSTTVFPPNDGTNKK